MLVSLVQSLKSDYKTVLEDLKAGAICDAVLTGILMYDASSNPAVKDVFSLRSGVSQVPVVEKVQLSKNITRERSTVSSPEQMRAQSGIREVPVDTIKSLLAQGLPLGLPEELLVD